MKSTLGIVAITASVLFVACGSNETNNSLDSARDSAAVNHSDNTSVDSSTQSAQHTQNATPLDEKTTEFVKEAASGGMMEVTLGQTAQQQAMHQRVKDFGAMMQRDHTKANEELKSIAQGKNLVVPATLVDKHQHHVDDLTKKRGKDFDKAYMKMMVDDHEEDIKKFEKAAADATDPAVKDFAVRTLPTLRMHLDSAKAINKALK